MSMTFPQKLNLEEYFKCPIWWADQPKFVNKLLSPAIYLP